MDDHSNCLQVPEFERYAAQQAAAAQQVADYQKVQNGSVQRIEQKQDKIFDMLDVIRDGQVATYKTITEINAATLATVQAVAQKREDDNKEHNVQREADNKELDARFSGIETTIGKMEQRQIWANYMKRIPKRVWIVLVSIAGLIATIIAILVATHVIH